MGSEDNAPETENQNTQSAEPVSSTAPAAVPPSPSDKKSFVKKIGIIPLVAVGAVLLIGGSAGAYFGVIMPNNPANLWKTSMTKTAKGLDVYTDYNKQLEAYKGSKLKGNFSVDKDGAVFDGNFEGAASGSDLNLKASLGASGDRVTLDLLTHKPDNAKNPDIYVRAQGLEGLSSLLGSADPSTSEFLSSINNQWFVLDHTAIDQMSSQTGASGTAGIGSMTNEDMLKIQDAVMKAAKDYIFSASPDKAVLSVRQNVGSEDRDGRKVYHYVVGVNKDHTKAFVTALKDGLKQTKLAEMYSKPSFEEAIDFDGMLKSIDGMKEEDSVDVWVDKTTKLLRSIKITNHDRTSDYMQLSLNYDGGKIYPIEVKLHNSKEGTSDVTLKDTIDIDKHSSAIEIAVDTNRDDLKLKVTATVNVEASNDAVQFTKPNDAKSVTKLLGGLLGGLGGGEGHDDPAASALNGLEL